MKNIMVMRYNTSGVELATYNNMVLLAGRFFELSDEASANEALQRKPTWNQDWSKLKQSIQAGSAEAAELDDCTSELVAEFAYHYLTSKGYDDYICSVLLKTKMTSFIFDYLRTTSPSKAIEKAVIDSNDPFWALEYCEIFGEVAQLKQILMCSGDAEWISRYCVNVHDDAEMLQALKNTESADWWDYYLQNKQAA